MSVLLLIFCVGALLWVSLRLPAGLVTPRVVFYLTLFGWYLFEMVFQPEHFDFYLPEVKDRAVLLVVATVAAFELGHLLPVGDRFRFLASSRSPTDWGSWFLGPLLAILVCFVGLGVYQTGSLREFLSPSGSRWSAAYSPPALGTFSSYFATLFVYVFKAVTYISVIFLFDRRAPLSWRLVSLTAWLVLLTQDLASGTRNVLFTSFGVLGIAWYLQAQGRGRLFAFVALPVVLFLLLNLATHIQAVRSVGPGVAWKLNADSDRPILHGNEMFSELCFIIQAEREGKIEYNYFREYLAELVNPIPRFLWPGKPIATRWEYARLRAGLDTKTRGLAATSISTGFIGQGYRSMGVMGVVVVALVAGWCCRALSPLLSYATSNSLAWPLAAASAGLIFFNGRDVVAAHFYPFVVVYCCLRLIVFVHGAKKPDEAE